MVNLVFNLTQKRVLQPRANPSKNYSEKVKAQQVASMKYGNYSKQLSLLILSYGISRQMLPFIDIGAPPRIYSCLALATKALAKPDENLDSKARLTTLFYRSP